MCTGEKMSDACVCASIGSAQFALRLRLREDGEKNSLILRLRYNIARERERDSSGTVYI